MKISTKHITPQVAKQILENNSYNRPLTQRIITEYAESMRRGEWELNGETIKIHEDGRLLDGQHRLEAVVRSDCSIDAIVVEGINGEAYNTIDTGHARSLAHMLSRDGEKNANDLSVAIRYYNIFKSRRRAPVSALKQKLSIKQGMSLLERTGILRHRVSQVNGWGGRHLGSVGLLAGAYQACALVGGEWADEFWEQVIAGTHLESGTPQYLLRQRLLKNKQALPHDRMSRSSVVALIIKAWNHYISGEIMESCRLTKADAEALLREAE